MPRTWNRETVKPAGRGKANGRVSHPHPLAGVNPRRLLCSPAVSQGNRSQPANGRHELR